MPESIPELLPVDQDLITADEELAAISEELGDDFDTYTEAAPRAFGSTWAFDIRRRRFTRYGGAPVRVSGIDSLRVWIEFTLQLARLAHPIFTEDYGVDDPWTLIGQPLTAELVADYEDYVTDALMQHDRIESVDDFIFTPDDDQLLISFTVTTNGPDAETLRVSNLPVGTSDG
jgi:hypothetical protein